jgi:hypothetical protein
MRISRLLRWMIFSLDSWRIVRRSGWLRGIRQPIRQQVHYGYQIHFLYQKCINPERPLVLYLWTISETVCCHCLVGRCYPMRAGIAGPSEKENDTPRDPHPAEANPTARNSRAALQSAAHHCCVSNGRSLQGRIDEETFAQTMSEVLHGVVISRRARLRIEVAPAVRFNLPKSCRKEEKAG